MRRRGLAALLTALIVAAVAPVPAGARATDLATSLRAINAMLAERSAAQRAHDRDRFAATIDPQAPAAFRDTQLRDFDGFASLPIATLSYVATDRETGDLTSAVNTKNYGGAPLVLVETRRTTTFERYDDRRALDDLWWTYVQRDGRWYVGGDADVADLGLQSAVSLWDSAPVITVPTEHFLVIAHPAAKQRAQALSALVERAVAVLDQRWKLPWSGKLVVILPGSPEELSALLQSTVDVTKFVAFVGYDFDPDTLRPTAPRMYIQDANLSQYAPAQQQETLVHELTHAAGSAYTSAAIPSWVHEGLAEWVAGGPDRSYPRPKGAESHAPTDDEFGAGTQDQIVLAYRDARSIVATLAAVAGRDAPFGLFRALGAELVGPGGSKAVISDALRTLGIASLTELETKWVGGR